MKLRSYQKDAVRDVYNALRRNQSAILQKPTGSGKTHVAAAIIKQGLKHNRRIWFIVDRLTLIDQTVDRFTSMGIRCGVIQGDHPMFDPSAPVQVISVQTLARRKHSNWRTPHLIIVDECHDQYQVVYDCMDEYTTTKFIGLSATPFTRGLGRHWNALVVAVTTGELIEQGYLSKYTAFGPSTPDMVGVATTNGDWNQEEAADRMDPLKGDIIKHYQTLADGKKAVCFTSNVKQAKGLAIEFNRAGYASDYVCGKDSDARRQEVFSRYENGEIDVLCNCEVLTKGWDSPDVEVAILARPTKSLSKHIQMLGRVLRVHPEGKPATIIDHAGNIARLGFPCDPLPTELCKRKKGVSSADRRDERIEAPWTCPGCYHVNDYGQATCAACGNTRRPEREKPETLPEVLKALKKDDRANKQTVYAQLNQIAHERKYSKGWVAHTYRGLFGVWPRGLRNVRMKPTAEMRRYVQSRLIAHAKRKEAENASV